MEIVNLSAEPLGKLHSWLPPDLVAEKVVFLPDACPGKSPLPTGTAVLTAQPNWREFAISDCGCGMRLVKSGLDRNALTRKAWNTVADLLRKNKGQLGDLGGGNHFLDALMPVGGGSLHFLVHTGSRRESGLVDQLIGIPLAFDQEFARIVGWAASNRAEVQRALEQVFGELELLYDLPHNTFEKLENGKVIIRKGSIRLKAGELCVIPSHMSGDVALLRATHKVDEILCSMSHGTGRKMSRGDCKPLADGFDFEELRAQILMPDGIENSSLRTEGPYAYRDLEECLMLIDAYAEEVERFKVVGYMGHL